MSDLFRLIEAEIASFQTWVDASGVPPAARSGEWAAGYPDWGRLYTAFDNFADATPCREWSAATTALLLSVIGWDDENTYLARSVAKRPDDLLCLAERAVTSPERDAKWQLAAQLGRLGEHQPQVEELLLKYLQDDEEYVRRMALLALADIGSPHVAELIEPAWASGSEYQRVDILYVLWRLESPELERYIQFAEADPCDYLSNYAARVRTGKPE